MVSVNINPVEDIINAYTFVAVPEGNVTIKIANRTEKEWFLWVGDRLWYKPNDVKRLKSFDIYCHNFKAYNGVFGTSTHWARIWCNATDEYAGFFIYNDGAEMGNNLFVITDSDVTRNNEARACLIQRGIDDSGYREIKWARDPKNSRGYWGYMFGKGE